MKILLTGATGFIGSHLLSALSEFEPYSLERYMTTRYAHGFQRKVKTVFADLRDAFAVRGVIRDVKPDVVIHLASISPVAYSYDHPQEVIEASLNATVNLAEACLREIPHFRQFIFASTSETYGNGPVPKTEETTQNPNSPYAVGKLAAEKYLLYMRDAYSFPVTVLRPFNTYGRKSDTHFVVEKVIVQMLGGDRVVLGDPNPVRDLLYVDDHVGAYMACLHNEQAIGQVYNFCTGRGVRIQELVDKAKEVIGFSGEIVWNTIPKRPLDIDVLIGSYDKANQELGWAPRFSLEEGIVRTVGYWRTQLVHGDQPSKVMLTTRRVATRQTTATGAPSR